MPTCVSNITKSSFKKLKIGTHSDKANSALLKIVFADWNIVHGSLNKMV